MKQLLRTRLIPFRANVKLALSLWGPMSTVARKRLQELTNNYRLSIAAGDLQLLGGVWYITHAGLLGIASRKRCAGIRVSLVDHRCDPSLNRWIFKVTVYKSLRSKGFVGFGDADSSNVSSLVRGAEMRVAETRAVNRALRKAYGIGLCSVEELGWSPRSSETDPRHQFPSTNSSRNNGFHKEGQPRLRDQLCLVIRQHNLDPTLVKAYAANFCGTQEIKDASRDLVESFISHLAASAKEDRDGLVCKLNSFAQPVEVNQ